MITAVMNFKEMITGVFGKPFVGSVTAISGGIGGLLTWIGMLTPIFGFISIIIGIIAGIYTIINQRRIKKEADKADAQTK
jgi:LytS/YehU family sensor histidine kinase